MNFKLSRHAQEEMRRRNIPPALLDSVLHHPQQIVPAAGGRKAYQSRLDFGGGKIFLLRAIVRVKNEDSGEWEERWTGDYIFENEWQSFRTKKDRSLELKSVFQECSPGRRKLAVKVVDIFGNDTMTIVEVRI